MSDARVWPIIVALSCVTLATRAGMLFLPAWLRLSPRLQRALRYAGPCILMAIVVPDLLLHDGRIDLALDHHRLYAALVAIAVFLATRSAALMIVVGLLALTALRLLA
jgi:branched-subunit amino acid transport protein